MPILLINIVEELSGTASLVKLLMKVTTNLFPDEKIIDNSLMVIFTHTQNTSKDQIMNKLLQLNTTMTNSNQDSVTVLKKILNWYYRDQDRVMNLMDPETDNPNNYWETINSLTPMKGIHEFTVEENSKNKFMILMEEFKISLHRWINERNFKEIIKIIELLSSLKENIPSLVSNTLDYYLERVIGTLQSEYSNIVRQVDLFLERKQIDDQHIKEILNFRVLVNKSKLFWEKRGTEKLIKSLEEFDNWFNVSVEKFGDEIKTLITQRNWDICKLHFEVIFKLSNHFHDLGFNNTLSTCTSLVLSFIEQILKFVNVDDYIPFRQKDKLELLSHALFNLTMIDNCLSEFIEEKFSCSIRLQRINETFHRLIDNLFNKYNNLLQSKEVINDTQIISDIMIISRNISECKEIHSYLGVEIYEEFHDKVKAILHFKVRELLDQLENNSSSMNENNINDLKNILLSCHLLIQFEDEQESNKRFYKITESTKSFTLNHYKELKNILSKWIDLDEEQIKRISKLYKRIKVWKWIDPITDSFGSKKYEKAKKNIDICISNIVSNLESHWLRKRFDEFNKPYLILYYFSKNDLYEFTAISNKYASEVIQYGKNISLEYGNRSNDIQPEIIEQNLKELEGFAKLETLEVAIQMEEANNAINNFFCNLIDSKCRQIQSQISDLNNLNVDIINDQLAILDYIFRCCEQPRLGLITKKYYEEINREIWNFLLSLIEDFKLEIHSSNLKNANIHLDKIKLYSKFSRHFPTISEEIRNCNITFLSASSKVDEQIKQSLWNCSLMKDLIEQQRSNLRMFNSSLKFVIDAFKSFVDSLVDNISSFDHNSNFENIIKQLKIFNDVSQNLSYIFNEMQVDFNQFEKCVKEEIDLWFDKEIKVVQIHSNNWRFNHALQLKNQISTRSKNINRFIKLGEITIKINALDKLVEDKIADTKDTINKLLNNKEYNEVSQIWNNTKLSIQSSQGNIEIIEKDVASIVRNTICAHFSSLCERIKNIDKNQTISKAEQEIKSLRNALSFEQDLCLLITNLLGTTEEELKSISSRNKKNFEVLLSLDDTDQVPNIRKEFDNLSMNDPYSHLTRQSMIQEKFNRIISNIRNNFDQQNFSMLNTFCLANEFYNNFEGILNASNMKELISHMTKKQMEISEQITDCLQNQKLEMISTHVASFTTISKLLLLVKGMDNILHQRILNDLIQYGNHLILLFERALETGDVATLSQITHQIHQFSIMVNFNFKEKNSDEIENSFKAFLQEKKFTERLTVFVNNLNQHLSKCLIDENFDELYQIMDSIEKIHLLEKWIPNCSTTRAIAIDKIKNSFNIKAEDCIKDWRSIPKNINHLAYKLKMFTKGEELLYRLSISLTINPLKEIQDEVQQDINKIRNTFDLSSVAKQLVNLRRLCESLPVLEQLIIPSIREYTEQLSSTGRILPLHGELERLNDPQDRLIVSYIISEFPAFKAFVNKLLADKTKHFGIEYALQRIKESKADGNLPVQINSQNLKNLYQQFDEQYKFLLGIHLTNPSFDDIVSQVRKIATDGKIRSNLPSLLANIFALWTLTKSDLKLVLESKDYEYLMKPHPVQVLSIFRLLSAERPNKNIENHLAEIKTGEGKSITLGVCAIIFALMGYHVDVVSYSNILSKRDREEFSDLFDKFGVQSFIKYGTIESLCEDNINRGAPVRDLVSEFLFNKQSGARHENIQHHRVILIDEVDVFFSSTFLGETYNPSSTIIGDRCYDVLKYIWQNYSRSDFSINTIIKIPSYASLIEEHPNMREMFAFQLEQMIADVKNFDDPNFPYKLDKVNGRIGYILHDEISYQISYGHKTTFAYFAAKDKGEITEEVLKSRVGFLLYCGRFSYAEIPKTYVYILGVTGTLQSLAPSELEIIRQFKINKFSYMPSMYGETDLDFKPQSDVFVLSDLDQYFKKIREMAMEYTSKGNAVLIFFNDQTRIDSFQNSNYSMPDWNLLIESTEDKSNLFRKATCYEQCTLSSKAFGRGTDFVCRDQQVIDAGGVVVIQTFFSTNPSESIQIKGRTARQGAKGIFRVVLLETDLLTFFSDEKTLKNEVQSRALYTELQTIRDKKYENGVLELKDKVVAASEINKVSLNLRSALLSNYDKKIIWSYLVKINHSFFSTAMASNYYIVMCLDYSGSMEGEPWTHLLQAVDAFSDDRLTKCKQTGKICNDILSVVCYNHEAQTVVDDIFLQKNISSLIQITPSGKTSFAAGISRSISQFENTDMGGRTPVFLFMSDGGCKDGDNEMITLNQKYSSLGMKVFVVGFGRGANEKRLRRLADICSGYYYFGATGDLLKHEFERIAYTLSSPVLHC